MTDLARVDYVKKQLQRAMGHAGRANYVAKGNPCIGLIPSEKKANKKVIARSAKVLKI